MSRRMPAYTTAKHYLEKTLPEYRRQDPGPRPPQRAQSPNSNMTEITPETALKILERWFTCAGDFNNRYVTPYHVHAMANQIADGEFLFNGHSIVISDRGAVLDGQHRLLACIEANRPIHVVLVRDVPEHTWATLDSGLVRTGTMVLATAKFKNPGSLASSLARLVGYTADPTGPISSIGWVGRRTGEAANGNLPNLAFEHPRMVEIVDEFAAESGNRDAIGLSTADLAFTSYVFHSIDEGIADKFFSGLLDGTGLSEGQPVLSLRERLIRDRISYLHTGRKTQQSTPMYFIFQAFRGHLDGKQILRFHTPNAPRFINIGFQRERLPLALR